MFLEVKNFNGYFVNEKGEIMGKMGKILRPAHNKSGYKMVILRKNNRSFAKTVHRIVAETFIENPGNLPEVNHKDENKENNAVENLEWCTHSYNNTYGTKIDRARETKKRNGKSNKKVICIEKGKVYNSITEAAKELNIFSGDISRACRKVKNHNTCGGYHWEYV